MKPKSKTQIAPVANDATRQVHGQSRDARWFEWICRAGLAGCFALFAWLSWRTWPDMLVDFGHELYIPWRLCEGEVLYRDIPFTMGPLSQYFNALLVRLFGVSLSTLIWANLAILAAITGMLYWLFRQVGSCWSATFVTFFFLAVFAFAQYSVIGNYNYVCPYRHEVTHGLALGLVEIICLIRASRAARSHALAGAGFCLGLIFLTKAEMFLPAAAVAGAALQYMARSDRRSVRRAAAILFISVAVPVVIAFVALIVPLGVRGAWEGTLGSWVYAVNPALTARSGFYQALGGWNRPVENFEQMALAAVTVLAGCVVAVLLEAVFRRFDLSRIRTALLGCAIAAVCVATISAADWFQIASFVPASTPLLLAAVIVATLLRVFRNDESSVQSLPLLWMSVFALFLLSKILLGTGWGHYGFVLAMPGTLVMIHVAVSSIPDWLRGKGYPGSYFQAVACGLLGACALVQAQRWIQIDAGKTLPFGEGGDRIYLDPRYDDRAIPTAKTLAYLQQTMRAEDTLVVIPEGTTLNYLLRKRNPSGFLMFSPWEFDAHGGEERFLKALMNSPPDYIVLVTMDMTIHGRGNFGAPEYGQRIHAWIDQTYQIANGFSSIDANGQPTFQSAVFKRKSP